uniref:Uncharacterized protein n=1 Tax=Cyprinodon variegatus TaxID=28743 RepID=A0A3Q2DL12_CYPVA
MADKELIWALKTGDLDEVKAKLPKVRGKIGFVAFHASRLATSVKDITCIIYCKTGKWELLRVAKI